MPLRRSLRQKSASRNAHTKIDCYRLYNFRYKGNDFGIVGCAVGTSFAVLIMEVVSLYAFSQAREKPVICIAQIENDFEQVIAHLDALEIVAIIAAEALANRLSINLAK